jgi:hypothetical protein
LKIKVCFLNFEGEHLTEYELADCLSNLLHLKFSIDDFNPDETKKLFNKSLPDHMSFQQFMTYLMGVSDEQSQEIASLCEKDY